MNTTMTRRGGPKPGIPILIGIVIIAFSLFVMFHETIRIFIQNNEKVLALTVLIMFFPTILILTAIAGLVQRYRIQAFIDSPPPDNALNYKGNKFVNRHVGNYESYHPEYDIETDYFWYFVRTGSERHFFIGNMFLENIPDYEHRDKCRTYTPGNSTIILWKAEYNIYRVLFGADSDYQITLLAIHADGTPYTIRYVMSYEESKLYEVAGANWDVLRFFRTYKVVHCMRDFYFGTKEETLNAKVEYYTTMDNMLKRIEKYMGDNAVTTVEKLIDDGLIRFD
jgi:hypothetical protein